LSYLGNNTNLYTCRQVNKSHNFHRLTVLLNYWILAIVMSWRKLIAVSQYVIITRWRCIVFFMVVHDDRFGHDRWWWWSDFGKKIGQNKI